MKYLINANFTSKNFKVSKTSLQISQGKSFYTYEYYIFTETYLRVLF